MQAADPRYQNLNDNLWLSFARPNPQAKLRLFCFPYAGGGALAFRTWPDGLPKEIEIYPVQPPGRENRLREPLFTRVADLVEACVPALLPHLEGPFAFFGHSVGSLVAFETLRYLRSHYGIQPLHLFASGRGAPQVPDPEPPIHGLPQAQFVEQVRDYNGTPEEVLRNAELMELFMPILRADFQLNETYAYTPGPPLDCPITAFAGLDDRRFSHETVRAWREQTRDSFSFQVFPGSHFFMHSAQALVLRAVAQGLSEYLRSVPA